MRTPDDAIAIKGHLLEELHPHPLFYHLKVGAFHSCDLCSDKIKGPAYRCTNCDFDCCPKCFAKKRRAANTEGVLRGDKGMKKEENVTNTSFVSRGLKLCAAHWKWLTSGLVCLMANVAAQLVFPNYQGKLIDRVVNMDREGFKYDVMMVLYISIATGAFAAVRQFSFRMVGTRMTNAVRNQLFSRLLSLDVAYYDGVRSGDLMSRLSGDVNALVQPVKCQPLPPENLLEHADGVLRPP